MVSYWVSTNFLSNKLDDVVDRLILENILYKILYDEWIGSKNVASNKNRKEKLRVKLG